jgi:toxin-antitoxin system PIN domain toxin
VSDSGYLIDTSVWIALAFPTHSHHREAVNAFSRCSSDTPAIFCRATQQSFLRIATTPAILQIYNAGLFGNRDAWTALQQFLALPEVVYRDEPPNLVPIWRRLAIRDSASPKVWMDAYLAAFAICGGYQFVTTDQAFKQYKGIDLLLVSQN